jgi:hypothetical protein
MFIRVSTLPLRASVALPAARRLRTHCDCTLSMVADYGWDAFDLPDLRGDWYLRRLTIEHRQIDYVPGGPGWALVGHPGKVLRSFEIERINRWDDDRDSAIMAWSERVHCFRAGASTRSRFCAPCGHRRD